jgi:alpha-tubulin suppressor-like RCC1 family protein
MATTRSQSTSSRIGLGQGRSALAVTAGASHSCALLDDFTVKCWGWNGEGELGIGAPGNTSDPLSPDGGVRDLMPVALGPGAVGRIAAGSYHTCAVQGPDIKCWGFGGSGRLGRAAHCLANTNQLVPDESLT